MREIDRRLCFLDRHPVHLGVVSPAAQTRREQMPVGATVTYLTGRDEGVTVAIVGVDEVGMA